MRTDYGEYLKAVIDRYKDHPALFGWEFTLGAMGEDAYGDYTEMLLFGHGTAGQFSDYSPYFVREFFKWLKSKYQSNEKLREAWGDSAADLNTATIPLPPAFFPSGQVGGLPDACYAPAQLSSPDFSQKADGAKLTMPSWTSEAARAAIRRIASYQPGPSCAADFALTQPGGCGDGTCEAPEDKVTCPQDCR